MLKRKIIAAMLAVGVCQPAFGAGTGITGVKDSADFAFKYEADVLPDAAGLGFVLVDPNNVFADTVSIFGGILTINTNGNSTAGDILYYELEGGFGTNWAPNFLGDFTVEIRTSVFPNNSDTFGAAVGMGDLNSSGLFSMFFNKVKIGADEIATAPNDDVFHTFRITSISSGSSAGQVYRIYRDGVQIGSDSPQITNFGGDLLRFGDFISGIFEANFDIDYLRWDTSGAWEPPPPALDGDLDGDGFVGIADLNIVLGNWNLNVPPGDPLADPSGDGFVGIADLNVVLGNWNAGTPPPGGVTVPEPASLALLGLGGLGLLKRRS